MSLQSSLGQQIQSYLAIDKEIQELNSRQRELRQTKQQLQESITQTMKSNGLENRVVKTGNYQFSINAKKQYGSLSFSYLEDKLKDLIPDTEEREFLLQHLRDNREVKTIEELRYNKV